ncbi:MAG: hypothetical protein Q9212_005050 [Teloschistes hypoglaucus]
MQTAVARLYACILKFFLSALQWYRDSRAAHAFKAIFQPWDIRFRGEYEAVAATAQQVGRLADVALKAEVRDIMSEVLRGREDLESVKREMSELLKGYQGRRFRHGPWSETRADVEMWGADMHQEIRLDLSSQRVGLSQVHLTQMLMLPLWDSLPTSGESLQFCRSIRKRRSERTRLPLPDIRKLEAWSSRGDNALLLIDTYSPSVAKTFMIDLIDLILHYQLPIIWALRYANYRDRSISVTDIARMLVLQTIQKGADRLLDSPFPVTVEQLREAAGLDEWVAILHRLLSSMDHAFVMLDADLLTHATAYERGQVLEMLDLLRSKLSGNVKIVTSTSCVGPSYVRELEDLDACIRVQTGDTGDWRKTRRQGRPAMRFRKW